PFIAFTSPAPHRSLFFSPHPPSPPPTSPLSSTTLFRSLDADALRSRYAFDALPDGPHDDVPFADRIAGFAFDAIRRVESEARYRSEEHTSELQSLRHLVCRLLLEKKKKKRN